MWAGDADAVPRPPLPARAARSPPRRWRPRLPILIGGTGERRTLPLVARYADACNVFDIPDGGATVRHKLDVLARHCDELGRDPTTRSRRRSAPASRRARPPAFAERCRGLAELGIEHVVLVTTGPWTDADLDVVCSAARLIEGE